MPLATSTEEPAMRCIVCSHDTKVTNSRPHKKTPSVWRRRECKSCGTTFTTHEVIADDAYELMVRDGQKGKNPFSLPRLMMSIVETLGHRDAASRADEAYWLAQTISQAVQASATDHVDSQYITGSTYETLSLFDATAALQYGARHGLITNSAQKARRGRPRTKRRGI